MCLAAGTVLDSPDLQRPHEHLREGTRARSTINRGDSGGPLLVRDARGAFRQVGVTALGSESTVKLDAGFTSVPVERTWIDAAIRSLRNG